VLYWEKKEQLGRGQMIDAPEVGQDLCGNVIDAKA
jgi:hypothetical protein